MKICKDGNVELNGLLRVKKQPEVSVFLEKNYFFFSSSFPLKWHFNKIIWFNFKHFWRQQIIAELRIGVFDWIIGYGNHRYAHAGDIIAIIKESVPNISLERLVLCVLVKNQNKKKNTNVGEINKLQQNVYVIG